MKNIFLKVVNHSSNFNFVIQFAMKAHEYRRKPIYFELLTPLEQQLDLSNIQIIIII